ncbi:MAG: DUF1957 domain-containing protein [Pedosphaera sp.]|nr:DUF1957 domain-containing protein [Pedosphaera sp.]
MPSHPADPVPSGCLALVLHAHLPWVRHPEHDRCVEEQWLFEATAECYLPLLRLMEGWSQDRLPWQLTLTLTATLVAMLDDPLLRSRLRRYLAEHVELCQAEQCRLRSDHPRQQLALLYEKRYRDGLELWDSCHGDLPSAFDKHHLDAHLEIVASAATHAVLPLLVDDLFALRGQILTGIGEYQRRFGRTPRGFWLPECAYVPEIEPVLAEGHINWFIVDSHGFSQARPLPRHATLAPIRTCHGLTAFARDPASARQVWSRSEGYPGDPAYREFHTDLADEVDPARLRGLSPMPDARIPTGIKYDAITGGDGPRRPYDRAVALQRVREHARHFLEERRRVFSAAQPSMEVSPLVVAPYDAELFGHWWFEGPEFLDAVVRGCCAPNSSIHLVSLDEYRLRQPPPETVSPAPSSWGNGGFWSVWLDSCNAQYQRPLRQMSHRLQASLRHPIPGERSRIQEAARELLLTQASDWPFLIEQKTAPNYARQRLEQHLRQVASLLESQPKTSGSHASSTPLIFPQIDPSHWIV